MSTLHHRVPLILSPADIETWLSGSAAEVWIAVGSRAGGRIELVPGQHFRKLTEE